MRNLNRNIIVLIGVILSIYLILSIYFSNHFFMNTVINGVDVSLESYADFNAIIKDFINDYELQIIEKSGETEKIYGKEIGLKYNEKNSLNISYKQNPFKWIKSLTKVQEYFIKDLYVIKNNSFNNRINKLKCLNKEIIEPKNVSFKYTNGLYEAVKEIYGNKINKDKLIKEISICILNGDAKLDLYNNKCYMNPNPKYTLFSDKTIKVLNLLNKYVKSKITYLFGIKYEILDGQIINKWISVDENLDIIIDEKAAVKYVLGLSNKYDTVGIERNFKTSTGKIVKVKGGLYGWKINLFGETLALLDNIKNGAIIIKEPLYAQKAYSRDINDIGSTYVEINITKQHIWFYKNGKLITHGSVVTGNPNKGNSTVTGTYMLNYRQNNATLKGESYEVKVSYWMPFYGSIGIHDATWRYSFGGEIYKTNGSRGCVNAPFYLAKRIFENIEEGIPIICYEE